MCVCMYVCMYVYVWADKRCFGETERGNECGGMGLNESLVYVYIGQTTTPVLKSEPKVRRKKRERERERMR